MITEQDLQEAIAECQGKRNPDANTCIKLAAFYIILDHMKEEYLPQYSYALPPPVGELNNLSVDYYSDSEFSKAINGRDMQEVWPVMDELMETIKAINPRLYAGVMRKLES